MKRAITGLVCAFWLASCASVPPPIQEMSDARLAIAAAVDAGASKHAPDALAEARVSLRNAEANLKRRAYAAAKRDAGLAKQYATAAREQSETRPGGPDRMGEQPIKREDNRP
ncbi:MAG: DUF4398 domain-containing protein [Pseudomonadota bacterium]